MTWGEMMEYYAEPGIFTAITNEKWIISELTFDLNFIFKCIKSVLIHPVDTKENKVKYESRSSCIIYMED
jgi:hypothetical protein